MLFADWMTNLLMEAELSLQRATAAAAALAEAKTKGKSKGSRTVVPTAVMIDGTEYRREAGVGIQVKRRWDLGKLTIRWRCSCVGHAASCMLSSLLMCFCILHLRYARLRMMMPAAVRRWARACRASL